MRIGILDDYFDTLRTFDCLEKLAGHDATIWSDHVQDTDALSEWLRDTEALVLIRGRTAIRAPLLDRIVAYAAGTPINVVNPKLLTSTNLRR